MNFPIYELIGDYQPLVDLLHALWRKIPLGEWKFSQAIRSLCANPCQPAIGQELWRILTEGHTDDNGEPNHAAIADLLLRRHDQIEGMRRAYWPAEAAA